MLLICMSFAAGLVWRDRIAFEFGYAYANGNFHGLLLPHDNVKAAYWLRLAATARHPRAQYMLGLQYAHGWGVKQDDALAEQWLNLASAQDYAPATFHLGWMYHKGEGVTADLQRSLWLMQQAASMDMAAAQLALGRFYESGEGVAPDRALALQWYRRAAETARERPEPFNNLRYAKQAISARDRLEGQMAHQETLPTQAGR